MGLLTEGKALHSEENFKVGQYVRDHGITQFLNTWKRVKDIHDDELRFGDEIECPILSIDIEKKIVRISARSAELRAILTQKENENSHQEGCTWHPEFGGWMIESTPARPYSNYASDLLIVERNMILRRRRLLSVLSDNEIAPTVTCFPLLGVGDFIANPLEFASPFSLSIYIPDYVINPHPRFAALTENIRWRRQSKVDIRVPLYKDLYTPEFLSSPNNSNFPAGFTPEDGHSIHMDCMGFGMGMCCLQVTFQARDVDESRYMYDQLAVLAPIMLAMTAATPIFKGRLADIDSRWTVIAQSVDDRTPAERGLIPDEDLESARNPLLAGDGIRRIHKSRYDSISTYIYHCRGDPLCQRTFASYNDIPCAVDLDIKRRLRSEGLDENLAHHLAHLFVRDPLVVFEGLIELDDEKSTDHFENIQSTNWNTCRWKPPPPREHLDDPHIGWRTEFRSMEVQLTDFENAAFTVFIVLVTRVLLAFDLAFYIPLSKVDDNMHRAHQRNAVVNSKFHFRKHVAPPFNIEEETSQTTTGEPCQSSSPSTPWGLDDAYEEMSMDEIFHGKESYYPGLIPLVYAYLDFINCEQKTFNRLDEYLQFISGRAKGDLITPATWMRQFVQNHPSYQKDSIITQDIAYDLMNLCKSIGEGSIQCPEILGKVEIERVRKEDAYGKPLAGKLSNAERSELLQRLVSRAHQSSKTRGGLA